MQPATVVRLALAGSRVDGLRVLLTTLAAALATLALLAALTVVGVGPDDGPYVSPLLSHPGLHPGVVIALVGLCVPVLALLAQCGRIGAPARDRRLAALRMAGATPRQVVRVVATEAGLATGLGAGLAVGGYFTLRPLLDTRYPGQGPALSCGAGSPCGAPAGYLVGALRWPVDVVPASWQFVVVVLGLPLLAVAASAVALRRVAFTPFGVVHRVRTTPPRVLPLVLVAVGVGGFFVTAALLRAAVDLPAAVIAVVTLGGFVLATVGLLSGQGAITRAIGTAVARRTSSPALLLAARRMVAEPFAATRATAVLTVAVLVAAGAQRLRQMTLAQQPPGDADPFYASTYKLVDLVIGVAAVLAALGLLVAAAEGIVARRRTYAAVVAAGTPRGVVGRAVLAETLLPLTASLLLATVTGTAAAVGFFGTTVFTYASVPNDAGGADVTTAGERTVGLPWAALGTVLALGLLVALVTTAAGLVFLRRATDVAELRAAA